MSGMVEGKVAVVTGGGQGVGFGIAREFVEQGASVVIADIKQALIDEAVAAIGPKCSGWKADVSHASDMEALWLADPREIGKTAVFLSSDVSSFITGVELFVDGGMAQTG